MHIDILVSAKWLVGKETDGYGTLPIPHRFDAEISSLLRAWLALDESSRIAALSQVSDEYRWTFLAYSERMASLAVRDRDKDHLLLGLLALGLDGWRGDWRDNAAIVRLHYDAALRMCLKKLRHCYPKTPRSFFGHSCAVPPPIGHWKLWAT